MWYMATRTRENRRLTPWPRACAGRCAALCDVRRLRRTGCQRSGPGPRERLRGRLRGCGGRGGSALGAHAGAFGCVTRVLVTGDGREFVPSGAARSVRMQPAPVGGAACGEADAFSSPR